MSYNMTQMQAIDSVGQLFYYANQHSSSFLMGGFLIAFFFILLMKLKRYAFEDALAVSSFFTMLFSLLGTWAGLVNWYYCLFFTILMAVSAVLVYQKNYVKK